MLIRNLQYMQSVKITEFYSHSVFLYKNFVKVTFLRKKMLKSWFDEIFFLGDSIFLFFHTVSC